jgi:hypothetical protein
MSRSHLFVIHGDLTHVHADGYLIPADWRLEIGLPWRGVLGDLPEPGYRELPAVEPQRIKWGVLERPAPAVASDGTQRDPSLLLVADIASTTRDISRPINGLKVALGIAADHWGAHGVTRRDRPLLAMPLIGCGRGGFQGIQGAVVESLLTALDAQVPGLPFDVVLVCYDRAQYAAVQSTRTRQRLCLPHLPSTFEKPADALAEHAAHGSLGVLFGAGVSMPLGLPSWKTLLSRLAQGTTVEGLGDLSGLDPMDAASLVLSGMTAGPEPGAGQEEFKRRLSESVTISRHSLAHGLLASLRPAVAVTTNYDRGYELALKHVLGDAPAVMPWDPPTGAGAARVVKLHGDVERGSIVLSREDFVILHATRRPLTALLQEQMLAQHVLAIGTTMSDSTLMSAVAEASTLLRSIGEDRPLGTLVMTQRDPPRAELLKASMHVLLADEPPPPTEQRLEPRAAARITDLLLDAVALRSMREHNYLADPQFQDLITTDPRLVEIAERARALRAAIDQFGQADQTRWGQIRQALDGLGATSTSALPANGPETGR